MIIAKIIASIGQTSRIHSTAVWIKKALSISMKAASKMRSSHFFGGSKHLHLLFYICWVYFIAVLRHRIAGDDKVAAYLIAPAVPAGLTAAGEEFEIWRV